MSNTIHVPSQHPHVPGRRVVQSTLPIMIASLNLVKQYTGFDWKVTSFLRESPNHSKGTALDIAPKVKQSDLQHYAVTHRKDPVLYNRLPLIRALQKLVHNETPQGGFDIGLFIEPDHIHIQLFEPENPARTRFYVCKWKVAKSCYHDNESRLALGPTNVAYKGKL